ncbi:MAG TPA: lysylphosphatidylglycerol synthase domain-containing protein [Solirubrobacteraceae bacterium]|nr:lysylphosphatidylglycerol synthase domain-containing protein [Solirubrobacteraceae bacterium]
MGDEAVAAAHGRLHLRAILICALLIVVIGAAATLFGWNISGWLKHVGSTIRSISLGYLLAAIVLITLQTTTTAVAWYSILRFAYPSSGVRWIQIYACYAAAVALNFVLPANLGTLAMMLMFVSIISAAAFAGVLGAYVVQKIFYTVIGIAGYVYLFLSVGGSFNLQFGFVSAHPWATALLLVGGAALLMLVAQVLRPRIERWWEQAKDGGEILIHPRPYLGSVLLPEFISWLAMLGTMAVFLSAYNIPVSFHTLMRIVAGNSIANMTSVTPGGAGVVQGFNVLSLKGITSASNATAYSVAQQLVTTAWSILLAIVLMIRAFGWTGGKTLVAQSYSGAREKASEQSAARKAKRQAKRAGTSAGEAGGEGA